MKKILLLIGFLVICGTAYAIGITDFSIMTSRKNNACPGSTSNGIITEGGDCITCEDGTYIVLQGGE